MKTTSKVLAVCGLLIAMLGGTMSSAGAQTLCVEQPILGMVDANGDGIATAGEILAVAPDNAELQAVVAQMQAQGYSGIQYSGCDGSSGGNGGGGGTGDDSGGDAGNGGTGGTGNGSGTGTGNETTGGNGSQQGGNDATGSGSSSSDASGTGVGGQTGESILTGPDGEAVVLLPSTGQGSSESVAPPTLAIGFGLIGFLSLLLGMWMRTPRRS